MLLKAEGKLGFSNHEQTQQQQVIVSATTTCTRMMSSILVWLTSTWPRVNVESELGTLWIVDYLKAGNLFFLKISILCCSGATWTIQTLAVTRSLAQKGHPITGHVRLAGVNVYHKMFIVSYWWSLLTESTWPYPAPRLIINSTPAPESLAGRAKNDFRIFLFCLQKNPFRIWTQICPQKWSF